MKILQDISFKEKFSVWISIISILVTSVTCIVALIMYTYTVNEINDQNKDHIYVMVDNKVLKLLRSEDFKSSKEASIKGSLELFHQYFWSLEPYKEYMETNLEKAFDMSDNSVVNLRNVLNDKGFYNNIIAGKHSTRYEVDLKDSVFIDFSSKPYTFQMNGKLRVLKPHEVEIRNLITVGKIKEMGNTENNFVGYDIIDYKVINFDLLKTLDYIK